MIYVYRAALQPLLSKRKNIYALFGLMRDYDFTFHKTQARKFTTLMFHICSNILAHSCQRIKVTNIRGLMFCQPVIWDCTEVPWQFKNVNRIDCGYIKLQIIGILLVGVHCNPENWFMLKCMGSLRSRLSK